MKRRVQVLAAAASEAAYFMFMPATSHLSLQSSHPREPAFFPPAAALKLYFHSYMNQAASGRRLDREAGAQCRGRRCAETLDRELKPCTPTPRRGQRNRARKPSLLNPVWSYSSRSVQLRPDRGCNCTDILGVNEAARLLAGRAAVDEVTPVAKVTQIQEAYVRHRLKSLEFVVGQLDVLAVRAYGQIDPVHVAPCAPHKPGKVRGPRPAAFQLIATGP